MKIGIDISQSVYGGTGVAAYTKNLVEALLKLNSNERYVLFGSSMRRGQDLKQMFKSLPKQTSIQAKFFPFPPSFLSRLWNNLHVVDIERFTGRVDIFHTSDWIEPPSICPKVTTIHDMIVYKYPELLNPNIVKTQRQRLEWVRKDGTFIIADSESTKQDIISHLKVPPSRIEVVYLGVSEVFRSAKPDAQAVLDKYLLQGPFVLSVGTREPRKNLTTVVEAFKQLNRSQLELLIVGKYGWGKDVVLMPQIRILETATDSELAVLYSHAQCFVYPSLYEGFGLPILEAMSAGTPVITSDRGSLKEIAAEAAMFADPQSAKSVAEMMEQVLGLNSTQRASQIEKGKQHAAQFTWEKTAQQTLNIYKGLI